MFEGLAAAIDDVEVTSDPDGVAELVQLHGRLAAKVAVALGELDASGEWAADGATSTAAWLRATTGLSPQTAGRTLRVARRLRALPVTRTAWVEGRLTQGQVDAVCAQVTERRAGLFAEHEAEVVPLLEGLDLTATATALREWAERADALLDDGEPSPGPPAAELRLSNTLEGRGYLNGSFAAEHAATVAAALRVAADPWSADDTRSHAQRQGDALVALCTWFLDHQHHVPAHRHRPHVNVIIDHDDLTARRGGVTVDGVPLGGHTVRRLLCDADVHRVFTKGGSTVLDYGRATRTVSPALFTTLVIRDRHCRFPGCDRPPAWCDAHHVTFWEDGGPTRPENLVLLCSRHHHLVHEGGWCLELLPDHTVRVTSPDGATTRTSHPPGVLRLTG